MTRYDDWSCDPTNWSPDKLRQERRNGMPAVVAEHERRTAEREASENGPQVIHKRFDDFSCNPSHWSESKLLKEKRNGMSAVMAEVERRKNEREVTEEEDYASSGLSFR